MNRLLWCAASLAFATSASAQVYKWVDKDGKVMYSDSPPPTAQSKQLNINTAPPTPSPSPAAAAAAASAGKGTDASAKDPQDAAKKSEEAAKLAAANEVRCKQATIEFDTMQQETRISRMNDKGERYYMDDAQREAEKARAKKAMDESCKK